MIVLDCLSSMLVFFFFFFQAEDGIRDAQESRGLGDVYKRQVMDTVAYADLHTILQGQVETGTGPDLARVTDVNLSLIHI